MPTDYPFYIHHLKGEELWLLPERAIYWPLRKTLLLSDLHLGKAGHFRSHGVYLPGNMLKQDLDTLESLMHQYDIERIIVLGDLFHSKSNGEWDAFGEWLRGKCTCSFELIKGNHDILPVGLYEKYGIKIHGNQLLLEPFLLLHHPPKTIKPNAPYAFCGHVHPGINITYGLQTTRVSCFWFGQHTMVLPAFGHLTGLYTIKPDPADDIFAIAGGHIIWLKEG